MSYLDESIYSFKCSFPNHPIAVVLMEREVTGMKQATMVSHQKSTLQEQEINFCCIKSLRFCLFFILT